jgi:hypothetical protein
MKTKQTAPVAAACSGDALVSLLLGLWITSTEQTITDVGATCIIWEPTIVAPSLLGVEESDKIAVTTSCHLWCFGRVQNRLFSRKKSDTSEIHLKVRPHIVV